MFAYEYMMFNSILFDSKLEFQQFDRVRAEFMHSSVRFSFFSNSTYFSNYQPGESLFSLKVNYHLPHIGRLRLPSPRHLRLSRQASATAFKTVTKSDGTHSHGF